MTQAVASREESREAYHAVLRVVDHQTTEVQPPGARVSTIVHTLANRYDRDVVVRALEAARSNDDLECWPDSRGRKRYTRSTPGAVRRIGEWEAESGGCRQELIGWANQRSSELADGGDA